MLSDILTLYCVCVDNRGPRHYQYNQKNIICNSISLSEERKNILRSDGYIFDDEGQNISYLNYAFGDLTATYWIWKNAQEEFLGTNQYRRFWTEDEMQRIVPNDKTIYLAGPVWTSTSVLKTFTHWHGVLGIDKLMQLSNNNSNFILRYEDILYLDQVNIQSHCNMFFCHKNLYDKLCSVLFEIMFDVFRISIEDIGSLDSYQRRMIAFLCETITITIIDHRDYYLGECEPYFLRYDTIL